jgi:Flp pilus assembly protein TadD
VGIGPARFRAVAGGVCVVVCSLALSGCFATDPSRPDVTDDSPVITTPTFQDDASVQYYPSDEPLRLAMEHFNRGDYGIAAHYFRDAVEKAPRDASAWIGLAASYDHIGRFDLADQAYKQAVLLAGESTALLNNRGYSYMLRGKFDAARKDLMKAYARDSGNPIIATNLKLLDGSERIIRRDPSAF